jgi:hypothetical protein
MNLSFCNIGGDVYSERISKIFFKSLIMIECERMNMKNTISSFFLAILNWLHHFVGLKMHFVNALTRLHFVGLKMSD